MSSTGAGYDYSPTVYSPDGRMYQAEYASKAVENAGTSVGIRCKDGVVLATEKIVLSKMLCKTSNRRLFSCDLSTGKSRHQQQPWLVDRQPWWCFFVKDGSPDVAFPPPLLPLCLLPSPPSPLLNPPRFGLFRIRARRPSIGQPSP